MDYVEIKDVQKELGKLKSTKIIIKQTSKKTVVMAKKGVNNIKNWYRNKKKSIFGYVKEEAKEIKDNKVNIIKEKEEKVNDLISRMDQQDEFRIGDKKEYREQMVDKLNNLRKKQIKVQKKGLGVFAIGKLYVTKLRKENNAKLKAACEKYNQMVAEEKERKTLEKETEKRALLGQDFIVYCQKAGLNPLEELQKLQQNKDEIQNINEEEVDNYLNNFEPEDEEEEQVSSR